MTRFMAAFKRFFLVVGGLLVLGLAVLAFRSWRSGASLERQLAAVRNANQPMFVADLTPPAVSPERNAATYLRRAEKSVDALNHELEALSDKHDEYYAEGRLNARGMELVESALTAYPDAVPLIEQAADAPEYAPDHDYTRPPEQFLQGYLDKVQHARAFARVLQYRGDLLLAKQQREESLQNGLTMLRLDRHFQREPMLVAYLVSIAIQSMGIEQIARGLQDGETSADLHDQIQSEVNKHLESQAFVKAIESDRAYGIDTFRNLRQQGPGWFGSLVLSHFTQDESDYLRRMAAEIRIGTSPRYEVESELAEMNADSQGAGALTTNMVPALEAAREAHTRSLARLRCLCVLNALSKLHREPADSPPSIGDLQLPESVTVDPYNGRPLKTKSTKAGWRVYSVGPNLKDDGGKIEISEDVGVGPQPE